MGLADNFESQLYDQLQIHTAWFPVANTFRAAPSAGSPNAP
jgi:hypothetical protein